MLKVSETVVFIPFLEEEKVEFKKKNSFCKYGKEPLNDQSSAHFII